MEVEKVPVQAIASALASAPDGIPSEFVRSEHERPGTTTFRGPVPEIPVVDLSEPGRGGAVVAASQEWGIFQVVNHGIPGPVIGDLQRVGREFFELPQAEKERYGMDPNSGRFEGYGTKLQKDLEGKKDWVDFFFHIVWPPSSVDYSIWPTNPPEYRCARTSQNNNKKKLQKFCLWFYFFYISTVYGLKYTKLVSYGFSL